MNRTIILLLTLLSVLSANCKKPDGKIKVAYDERIELMSILCRLAGFGEYNMNAGGKYIAEIDSFFSEVKNHPAVVMMDSLRQTNGIAFDAPMTFAVNLKKTEEGYGLACDTIVPEKRWEGVDLRIVTQKISDFYNESDFKEFFKSHEPFYQEMCDMFNSNVTSRFNQDWYEQFYGVPPTENFEVVIGFVNGGANYGPSRQLPGEPRDVYAIMGFYIGKDGVPYFVSDPVSCLNTLVHEFNHSFVNHLTKDERFAEQIQKAGKGMMTFSAQTMRRQAYGSWDELVNESIVRAAVIRYMIDNGLPEDEIRQSIVDEMSSGFYWMPELVVCMAEYADNRQSYTSIDKFYLKIADFFDSYAKNCSDAVDAVFRK